MNKMMFSLAVFFEIIKRWSDKATHAEIILDSMETSWDVGEPILTLEFRGRHQRLFVSCLVGNEKNVLRVGLPTHQPTADSYELRYQSTDLGDVESFDLSDPDFDEKVDASIERCRGISAERYDKEN